MATTPTTHRVQYRDIAGDVIVLTIPWGDGTGWIPPGHLDFQMTVTHETRRFVYAGEGPDPA
jgi:hypothetical protein